MRTFPLAYKLGLLDAVRTIGSGSMLPSEYAAALRERAHRIDPAIHAFTVLSETDVEDGVAGPLGGVPVAVKDIIATRDLRTENGSPAWSGHVPDADAWIVERLRNLGASILGKTVTTEFAWRHPSPTLNPWNHGHTPGGSSSGSAAAVAAGLAPLALGTQTYGSVIRPAAFCGVVGFKPSYGAIPRTGVFPLAYSLDHVGLFTRSVLDAAYALSLFAGASDTDRHGIPLPPFTVSADADLGSRPPPRLALVRVGSWDDADPAALTCLEAAATRFREAGAHVEELALPDEFAGLALAARRILASEAAQIHRRLVADRPGEVSAHVRDLVAEGMAIAAPDYVDALKSQAYLRERFRTVLGGFDALLTLPAAGPAPEGLGNTGDPSFTVPFTFLGAPCISIPAGETNGLPLGVQLAAPHRDDLRLLWTAFWCETVLDRPVTFPVG